jgi:hypothetical protein
LNFGNCELNHLLCVRLLQKALALRG